MSEPAAPPAAPALSWDVLCRVVDNFGDIGVCWRLACDLAERGQRVRLWVDDATALRWMAPADKPGVEVKAWLDSTVFPPPGDVVVEAFGCTTPDDLVAALALRAAEGRAVVWLDLEYLSAEDYVERSHGLPSPRMSDPGRGLVKWFFYPGFTPSTGGLLREASLAAGQAAFDRSGWLAAHELALRAGERLVSVFCYPGAPLDQLVAALAADDVPTLLATAPGAATGATRAALAVAAASSGSGTALLRQQPLPWLSQADYDRLLWAADLNFVRGEDSWVRAHWAGRPFVWQAYRQDDGAHAAKVAAFLDRALRAADPVADAALRAWTMAWNGLAAPATLPAWTREIDAAVGQALRAWSTRLADSADLVTRLLTFVQGKR